MKKERRWLKSALIASTQEQITLPWARGTRKRPEAMKAEPVRTKPRALAAH